MGSVAFICPLYDKGRDFEFALGLHASKAEHGISHDFYYVFSDGGQEEKYGRLLGELLPGEPFRSMVVPEEFLGFRSQAVVKKLQGLRALMRDYDYLILVDCESLFIRPCDFGQLAGEIWDSRSMLAANRSPDGYHIMRRCYDVMGLSDNRDLLQDLGGFQFNFWFNELQVYKCSLLPGFFEWLDKFDVQAIYDEKLCFEYYMFYAYLLLEHGYRIVKYDRVSMGGINEYIRCFEPGEQRAIVREMGLHWTSSEAAVTDDVVMLFHLDRGSESYSYPGMNNLGWQMARMRARMLRDSISRMARRLATLARRR